MPNLINPYSFSSVAPPVSSIAVASSSASAMTATNSPTVTVPGYTPLANDVVVSWISTIDNFAINTVPAGWVNALGGTTTVGPTDSSLRVGCFYHIVTAGEESANTNSWTLTSLWNTPETGEVLTAVVRGAETTTVIDATNSASNASTVTSHVLAGLTGADLSTGSLVVSGLFADGLVTYTTPADWTSVCASTATNQGGNLYSRDVLTTAGVDVTAASATASVADEYASITLAILAAS